MDFYFHILNGLIFPYSKWTFISFRFISYSILCTLIFFIPFHSFLFLSIPFYNFLFYYFLFFSPFRSQSTIGFLPIFFLVSPIYFFQFLFGLLFPFKFVSNSFQIRFKFVLNSFICFKLVSLF